MGGTQDPILGRCPACHSIVPRHLGRKEVFEVLSCQKCGTIYTSSSSDRAQAQDYDGYYTSENLSVPDFIHKRLDEIVAGFSGYRVYNRMLEIGFGAGSLLAAASRAGWDVEGVEVSESAVKHSEAQGFKTFRGKLSEAGYEAGSFDLVIATELLEHVQDPGAMIREIARILRPGGLFWGTTPNARGISPRLLGLDWSVICPPEHLHLLSENGVRNLLAEAGFRKVSIATEGTNPFELVKWRGRKRRTALVPGGGLPSASGCDRVNADYRLNESLMKSGPRRTVKNLLNGLLRLSHLGDSLKIWAER
jgi:2-polyprenyl-6-hydroxyphenyl methylase/3-demethylubiquinone-9 3-methyltransferase